MSNKRIKVTCTILMFSFLVCLAIFQPQNNTANIFKCISISASATIFLSILYFNVLWKIKPFNELHKDILVINGKWISTLTLQDQTSQIIDIKINQTFDNVTVHIKGPDFSAKSIASSFVKFPDKLILYFIYQTKENKKGSTHTPHIGTMKLQCGEKELKGVYYNDLKESDNITFIKVEKEEKEEEN